MKPILITELKPSQNPRISNSIYPKEIRIQPRPSSQQDSKLVSQSQVVQTQGNKNNCQQYIFSQIQILIAIVPLTKSIIDSQVPAYSFKSQINNFLASNKLKQPQQLHQIVQRLNQNIQKHSTKPSGSEFQSVNNGTSRQENQNPTFLDIGNKLDLKRLQQEVQELIQINNRLQIQNKQLFDKNQEFNKLQCELQVEQQNQESLKVENIQLKKSIKSVTEDLLLQKKIMLVAQDQNRKLIKLNEEQNKQGLIVDQEFQQQQNKDEIQILQSQLQQKEKQLQLVSLNLSQQNRELQNQLQQQEKDKENIFQDMLMEKAKNQDALNQFQLKFEQIQNELKIANLQIDSQRCLLIQSKEQTDFLNNRVSQLENEKQYIKEQYQNELLGLKEQFQSQQQLLLQSQQQIEVLKANLTQVYYEQKNQELEYKQKESEVMILFEQQIKQLVEDQQNLKSEQIEIIIQKEKQVQDMNTQLIELQAQFEKSKAEEVMNGLQIEKLNNYNFEIKQNLDKSIQNCEKLYQQALNIYDPQCLIDNKQLQFDQMIQNLIQKADDYQQFQISQQQCIDNLELQLTQAQKTQNTISLQPKQIQHLQELSSIYLKSLFIQTQMKYKQIIHQRELIECEEKIKQQQLTKIDAIVQEHNEVTNQLIKQKDQKSQENQKISQELGLKIQELTKKELDIQVMQKQMDSFEQEVIQQSQKLNDSEKILTLNLQEKLLIEQNLLELENKFNSQGKELNITLVQIDDLNQLIEQLKQDNLEFQKVNSGLRSQIQQIDVNLQQKNQLYKELQDTKQQLLKFQINNEETEKLKRNLQDQDEQIKSLKQQQLQSLQLAENTKAEQEFIQNQLQEQIKQLTDQFQLQQSNMQKVNQEIQSQNNNIQIQYKEQIANLQSQLRFHEQKHGQFAENYKILQDEFKKLNQIKQISLDSNEINEQLQQKDQLIFYQKETLQKLTDALQSLEFKKKKNEYVPELERFNQILKDISNHATQLGIVQKENEELRSEMHIYKSRLQEQNKELENYKKELLDIKLQTSLQQSVKLSNFDAASEFSVPDCKMDLSFEVVSVQEQINPQIKNKSQIQISKTKKVARKINILEQ